MPELSFAGIDILSGSSPITLASTAGFSTLAKLNFSAVSVADDTLLFYTAELISASADMLLSSMGWLIAISDLMRDIPTL